MVHLTIRIGLNIEFGLILDNDVTIQEIDVMSIMADVEYVSVNAGIVS